MRVDIKARLEHPSLDMEGKGQPLPPSLPQEAALQILDCACFLAEEGIYWLSPAWEDFSLLPVREDFRFGVSRLRDAVYYPEQELRELATERLGKVLLAGISAGKRMSGASPEPSAVETALQAMARGEIKSYREVLSQLDYEPTPGSVARREETEAEPDLEALKEIYRFSLEVGLKAETFFLAFDLALRSGSSLSQACLGIAATITLDKAWKEAMFPPAAWESEKEPEAWTWGRFLEEEISILEAVEGKVYLENYFTLSPTAYHLELEAENIAMGLSEGWVRKDVVQSSYHNSERQFEEGDARGKEVLFPEIAQEI